VCRVYLSYQTALLEYLDLLQGGYSPPAPPGSYMIMIIKMIEIYNIAAQSYMNRLAGYNSNNRCIFLLRSSSTYSGVAKSMHDLK